MRGPGRATQVASAHWETLTAEAEAIAEEFEEDGWETLVVHPGSVTAVHEHDRCGLDVVIPGNEYEPLAALVEERGLSFPISEVYAREEAEETFERAADGARFGPTCESWTARRSSSRTTIPRSSDPSDRSGSTRRPP